MLLLVLIDELVALLVLDEVVEFDDEDVEEVAPVALDVVAALLTGGENIFSSKIKKRFCF